MIFFMSISVMAERLAMMRVVEAVRSRMGLNGGM